MEQILRWIYSHKLKLKEDNLPEALETAHHLKWLTSRPAQIFLEKWLKLHSGAWVKTQVHASFYHIWT